MNIPVTKKRLIEATDYTDGQIRGKIDSGKWVRGLHYSVIDGERRYHLENIVEWMNTQDSVQEVGISKSASCSRASGTRTRTRSRGTPPTAVRLVV